MNIVYYHIAANGDAIIQLYIIHETLMQRKYVQVHKHA